MIPLFHRVHPRWPVFAHSTPADSVFYAPGHLVKLSAERARVVAEALAGGGQEPLAAELLALGREAVDAWENRLEAPFTPRALLLYLGDECGSCCSYCWARRGSGAGGGEARVLSEPACAAASRLVAENCARAGQPLAVAFHGAGEPTRPWHLFTGLVQTTRLAARNAGIDWQGYVATNGDLEPDAACWLGDHLNEICISCDGPPDLHDRQRPLRRGGSSARLVERTARAVLARQAVLSVRATITPGGVSRQKEIVEYLCGELGVRRIRFEPVYRGAGGPEFAPGDAPRYVQGYLEAEAAARQLGAELSCSGSRLDELHGPFCPILDDVLCLRPDGTAGACFLDSRVDESLPALTRTIGHLDPTSGDFVLHRRRIEALRRALRQPPERCRDCVAVSHCARDCPDRCLLASKEVDGFRCRVQRLLVEAWLCQATGTALSLEGTASFPEPACGEASASPDEVRPLLARDLPEPIWSARGFDHRGGDARAALAHHLGRAVAEAALSVYVHVPFCKERCCFCDLHAIPHRDSAREDRYVQAVTAEAQWFGRAGCTSLRPVTTIHFGGGTPTCLRHDSLGRLVEVLRRELRVTDASELALESTVSLLAEPTQRWLRSIGFTRLHLGVQTLEPDVRSRIGRAASSERVLEVVKEATVAGFVVSVDVIYGLPGQTLDGLLDSLERLAAAGASGVSLYHLQISRQNQRRLARLGLVRDLQRDLGLLEQAEALLRELGYQKTHFNHYARPEDRNLYYEHVSRREDLLALGPSADGVVGGYCYRHHELGPYLRMPDAERPALEGGTRVGRTAQSLASVIAALTAARVAEPELRRVGGDSLARHWLAAGLVESARGGELVLAARGSFCLAEMLVELESVHAARAAC